VIDPRHPVVVAAAQRSVRTADAEPIAMMADAAAGAFATLPQEVVDDIHSVRVVRGIWPYADAGRLVAAALSIDVSETAATGIGGNATYDLVNHTALQIAHGHLDAALVCGAETMRTRRADNAAGRSSTYLDEPAGAEPDFFVGGDDDLFDDADIAAGVAEPVNFYAMAESCLRHRQGDFGATHAKRISSLWAQGAAVAAGNPNAWIRTAPTAADIGTTTPTNRMVAAPYPKLMSANINVDQSAAIVLTSYELAAHHGVPDEQMLFLVSGSGAYEHPVIRQRWELDRSPAFSASAERALSLADRNIDDIDHLDLYSCFPSSVQLAQAHLGVTSDRPFTITGGLTFAGGPFNGYCTQALAQAHAHLAGTAESAFLHGNGGFFSKQSVMIVSGETPGHPYRYERVQDVVDATPSRPLTPVVGPAVIEASTVVFERSGEPGHGIISALGPNGARTWAVTDDRSLINSLLCEETCGREVLIEAGDPPVAALPDRGDG